MCGVTGILRSIYVYCMMIIDVKNRLGDTQNRCGIALLY